MSLITFIAVGLPIALGVVMVGLKSEGVLKFPHRIRDAIRAQQPQTFFRQLVSRRCRFLGCLQLFGNPLRCAALGQGSSSEFLNEVQATR